MGDALMVVGILLFLGFIALLIRKAMTIDAAVTKAWDADKRWFQGY